MVMKIVIAGGTGFLGSPLAEMYAEEGHDVRVLTRALPPEQTRHDPAPASPASRVSAGPPTAPAGPWAAALDGADGVDQPGGRVARVEAVDAGGEDAFRDSRILATRSLAAAIRAAATPPPCSSAAARVGYYGPSDNRPLTESVPPGTDFLAQLCAEWETEARQAERPARASCCSAPASCSSDRRRAAADDAAVPVLRRRSARIGPAVHVVDPPARLDRDGALDRGDAGGERTRQRHRAAPGDQPAIRRALGRAMHRPSSCPRPASR